MAAPIFVHMACHPMGGVEQVAEVMDDWNMKGREPLVDHTYMRFHGAESALVQQAAKGQEGDFGRGSRPEVGYQREELIEE